MPEAETAAFVDNNEVTEDIAVAVEGADEQATILPFNPTVTSARTDAAVDMNLLMSLEEQATARTEQDADAIAEEFEPIVERAA